jgi:hypothetical protein
VAITTTSSRNITQGDESLLLVGEGAVLEGHRAVAFDNPGRVLEVETVPFQVRGSFLRVVAVAHGSIACMFVHTSIGLFSGAALAVEIGQQVVSITMG